MTASKRPQHQAKVKFQERDVFLSVCISGDEEEIEDMLEKGANINFTTIDGVTALHQAVIDDNLNIVRFLVEHGADIDAQDNEGWTPLHAAVCCGSLPIVKYLCEKGADLTLTNSDKELAVDLAEDDEIRLYLEEQNRLKNVNVEKCRERELNVMMNDCAEWIRIGRYLDKPHPKTGATALHVAASKGYNHLIEMLICAGADVHSKDFEGWTPLHAAAHWAEKDSCRILMENGASIDDETFSGQNVLTVADKAVVDYLRDLEEKLVETRKKAMEERQIQIQQQQATAGRDETSRESSTVSHSQPLSKSSSQISASQATVSSGGSQVSSEYSSREASVTASSTASVSTTASTSSISGGGSTTTSSSSSSIIPPNVTPSVSATVIYRKSSVTPTPPTQPTYKESEAERKATSRIQRHSRRSTQGVSLEHVGEAAQQIASPTSNASTATSQSPSTISSTSSIRSLQKQFLQQNANASAREESTSRESSVVSQACTLSKSSSQTSAATQPIISSRETSQLKSDFLSREPSVVASSSSTSVNTSSSGSATAFANGNMASLPPNGKPSLPAPMLYRKSSVTPTPPTQPTYKESEAERKATSRMQRHSRRSTQGVSLEHVGEAIQQLATSPSTASSASSQSASTISSSIESSERGRIGTITTRRRQLNNNNNNIASNSNNSVMDDQERRAFERHIAALEYELEKAKQNCEKLKNENMALIRVLKKLSK